MPIQAMANRRGILEAIQAAFAVDNEQAAQAANVQAQGVMARTVSVMRSIVTTISAPISMVLLALRRLLLQERVAGALQAVQQEVQPEVLRVADIHRSVLVAMKASVYDKFTHTYNASNESYTITRLVDLRHKYNDTQIPVNAASIRRSRVSKDYIYLYAGGRHILTDADTSLASAPIPESIESQVPLQTLVTCAATYHLMPRVYAIEMFRHFAEMLQVQMSQKDAGIVYELHNMVEDKSGVVRKFVQCLGSVMDVVHIRLGNKLHHYVHFNELLQLLFALSDVKETNAVRLQPVLRQCIAHYDELCQKHNITDVRADWREHIANATVHINVAQVMQMLIASEAIVDLYAITQDNFNTKVNNNVYRVVRSISGAKVVTEISCARITHMLQLYIARQALLQHMKYTGNVIQKISVEKSRNMIKLLEQVLHNVDTIAYEIVKSLQSHIYSGIVHFMALKRMPFNGNSVYSVVQNDRHEINSNMIRILASIIDDAINSAFSVAHLKRIMMQMADIQKPEQLVDQIFPTSLDKLSKCFGLQMYQYMSQLMLCAYSNDYLIAQLQSIDEIPKPPIMPSPEDREVQTQYRVRLFTLIRLAMQEHGNFPQRVNFICENDTQFQECLADMEQAYASCDDGKIYKTQIWLEGGMNLARIVMINDIALPVIQIRNNIFDFLLSRFTHRGRNAQAN